MWEGGFLMDGNVMVRIWKGPDEEIDDIVCECTGMVV